MPQQMELNRPSSKPSIRDAKSNARRSLPIPTTRAPSSQQSFHSSTSTTLASHTPGPSSLSGALKRSQRSGPAAGSESCAPKSSPKSSHSASSSRSNIGRPISTLHTGRHTQPVSNSTSLPIPACTQPAHRVSASSTATSPTRVYGSFTPANAVGRSSTHGRESLATPKGPKPALKFSIRPNQAPSKKATSPYLNQHVADPCIPGSLVHQLSPCGHKIISTSPDPCASNCRRPLQEALSIFANIPQGTEPFICAACVEFSVRSHREMKRALFDSQMERTELQFGGFPVGWKDAQREYWERVWENDMSAERAQFEKLGRKSRAIPCESLQEGEAERPITYSGFPSPWPPARRPLASRTNQRGNTPNDESIKKG